MSVLPALLLLAITPLILGETRECAYPALSPPEKGFRISNAYALAVVCSTFSHRRLILGETRECAYPALSPPEKGFRISNAYALAVVCSTFSHRPLILGETRECAYPALSPPEKGFRISNAYALAVKELATPEMCGSSCLTASNCMAATWLAPTPPKELGQCTTYEAAAFLLAYETGTSFLKVCAASEAGAMDAQFGDLIQSYKDAYVEKNMQNYPDALSNPDLTLDLDFSKLDFNALFNGTNFTDFNWTLPGNTTMPPMNFSLGLEDLMKGYYHLLSSLFNGTNVTYSTPPPPMNRSGEEPTSPTPETDMLDFSFLETMMSSFGGIDTDVTGDESDAAPFDFSQLFASFFGNMSNSTLPPMPIAPMPMEPLIQPYPAIQPQVDLTSILNPLSTNSIRDALAGGQSDRTERTGRKGGRTWRKATKNGAVHLRFPMALPPLALAFILSR